MIQTKENISATRALDYLLLDIDARINYRAERNISLQQWYESFRPQPIQEEDMTNIQVYSLLGILPDKFYDLRKKGYFGESSMHRERVKVSDLNRILKHESYLIPVSTFREIIKEQQWHISRPTFDKLFKKYYERGLDQKNPYVSINNAAKIVYELRKRKTAIEEWPTLQDLFGDSGLDLTEGGMRAYFGPRIRSGEIPHVVITLDSRGRNTGRLYKIPPHAYQEILAIEIERSRNSEIGFTTSEMANVIGITPDSVRRRIRGGKRLGLLHPLKGRGFGIAQSYLLSPEEAGLVIGRKIPRIEAVIRTEQQEQRLEQIHPDIRIPPIAEELWYQVKSGDQQAFSIIFGLYEPIIAREANNPVFGMTKEERLMILYTGFYEMIMELNMFPSNGRVIRTLREKLKQRKRQEAPSWVSLDERLSSDSTDTLLDFVDTKGHLWSR